MDELGVVHFPDPSMACELRPKNVYPQPAFLKSLKKNLKMSELAQAVFEYARRGKLEDLLEIVDSVHPDEYVAYDGSTALLIACKNGHSHVSQVLISKGADISLRVDDGSTALLLAVCAGNVDLVLLVLKFRMCDLNERNEDGFPPLDLAQHYGHEEIVSSLVSHKAKCGVAQQVGGEFSCGPSEKWGYGVFD